MAVTTPNDVIDRWIGEEIPATTGQLTVLIDDAEDMILTAIPDITTLLDAGTVTKPRYVRVVARMVHRVLHNPEGFRQRSHTSGPFSEQVMFSGDSPGGMEFTAQDREDLLGAVRGRRRRAFTIMPSGVA